MLSQLLVNSTSPLILISGIGILLLVISNRITHVIDRIRELTLKTDKEDGTTTQILRAEIQIMMKRARTLRTSMVSLCASILSSTLLLVFSVLEAFNEGVYHFEGSALLVVSILGIAIAAACLLRDAIYSLHALQLDLQQINLEESS
ncbi:MAG: DUF2721 domain-containing protein [Campylobacterota bacterium]|nr:DUF2721 domain-containing protein [Campylobacterota bacterium]